MDYHLKLEGHVNSSSVGAMGGPQDLVSLESKGDDLRREVSILIYLTMMSRPLSFVD
jgi:hypothetical protein